MSREHEAEIEAEIERIRSLPINEVRTQWRQMFKLPPPSSLGKDMLGRMIAYRIQEKAFGGLSRASRRILDELAGGKQAIEPARRRLKPGTVLVREYQGERHTVTVAPDGFVWREATYTSLSTIAHLVTGTNWNGPKFFGLRSASDKIRKAEESMPDISRRSNRRAR
jgi:hypothetical protein